MPALGEYSMAVDSLTWTIAQNQQLSGSVDTSRMIPSGIQMPSGWDAANLTFKGSLDNVTFNDIYDESGNLYTVVAAASRLILLDPTKFFPCRYIKVNATAAQTTTLRTLLLVVRYP